jgi:hypothetical protein
MIRLTVLWASLTLMAFIAASALAESKAEKTFSGVLMDADGAETELRTSSFIGRKVLFR